MHSIPSSIAESNLQVINFPRPRLLNEKFKCADRCDRQTDGQTPAAVRPQESRGVPPAKETNPRKEGDRDGDTYFGPSEPETGL